MDAGELTPAAASWPRRVWIVLATVHDLTDSAVAGPATTELNGLLPHGFLA